MSNIYINSKLKLSSHGLRVKDSPKGWIDLHCQQGRIDGACAVYSVAMALLALGYLNSEDIKINGRKDFDHRTGKGKFLSSMLEQKGMHLEGNDLNKLTDEINRFCHKEISAQYYAEVSGPLLNKIQEAIEADSMVIVGVDFIEGGHALFVSGIEYDQNNRIRKILCLDPAFPLSNIAYWNSFLEIPNNQNGEFPIINVNDLYNYRVKISDIIIIDEKRL